MDAKRFIEITGAGFFAGVPDSLLKPLCDCLYETYGISDRHIIAANEGNAVALAAGHFLATGEVGTVYMQNSGIGNTVNPVCSLLNEKVYGIPVLFVVGWRGEPGAHDEPQHVFQGEVTLSQLEALGIECFVLTKETSEEELGAFIEKCEAVFENGRSAAVVVKKGALSYGGNPDYSNGASLSRERAIEIITEEFEGDIFVSTTGKASRELFEIRERRGEKHETDFLTVGSMGHSSSIALAIALAKPESRVVCIDGDGAMLMHLGAVPVIGELAPENLVHVVINNGAHDTVGGEPVALKKCDVTAFPKASGYGLVTSACSEETLRAALETVKNFKGTAFLEVRTANGARKDLGRPTLTARQNVEAFREFLKK